VADSIVLRTWERLWFAPEGRTNMAVARVLLVLAALWIVLSRRDLPSVLEFPQAILGGILPERRLRFGLLFGAGSERVLWYALHGTLIATLFGVATRWAALASGLLLYHLAPLETIIWTGNPYLRGLTIPALGLLVVAASASAGSFPRRGAEDDPSWENRWPLALIQLLFAQIYFFAGWSKLVTSGLSWLSPLNIRNYVLVLDQTLGFREGTPGGNAIVRWPALAAAVALAGIFLDLLFPLVLVSRRARWILLPATAFFNLANGLVFHIWFQNAPLLLLFVDWDALRRRR
jgi:hypothetical protein